MHLASSKENRHRPANTIKTHVPAKPTANPSVSLRLVIFLFYLALYVPQRKGPVASTVPPKAASTAQIIPASQEASTSKTAASAPAVAEGREAQPQATQ